MRKEPIVRSGLIASVVLMVAVLTGAPSRVQSEEEGPDTSSFVYVTNFGAGTVSVIDTTTKHPVGDPIPTCGECGEGNPGPAGIAVTPNGRFLYVANELSNSVGVIDLSTHTVSDVFLCSDACPSPVGVAITPDGKFVYVTDNADAQVYKFQTSDNSYTTIPVGANPSGVAVDPTGSFVYVTNTGDGTVSVFSTDATNDVIGSPISVGADPTSVAFQPGAHIAYVTDEDTGGGSGALVIIDTTHNTVSRTIPLTNLAPYFVAFTPDGKSAYVTNQAEGAGSVLVINTATQAVSSTIGLESTPVQVAITPDGGTAYVAVGSYDDVYPITTGSSPSLGTGIGVGEGASPYGVAVGPVSETQTLDTSGGTLTFPFLGASISFTFPADWCSTMNGDTPPCTITAAATDTPDAVWQTESANYPGTHIAPITGLPGGGNAGGDGYVYTVTCTDKMGLVCNQGSTSDSTIYTTNMTWDTFVNICGMGPGLGKEETTTWENILGLCTFTADPAAGTNGTSRDGLSRWASFYHITGTSSATVSIANPPNGMVYELGDSANANYSCGGAFSECAASNNFAGQTLPVASGQPVDTSTSGLHTLTAEADVISGPTAKATVVYFVDATYGVQLLYPANAAVKSPATFPIKMYLTSGGHDVSSSSLVVNAFDVLFINGNSSGDPVVDAGNSNADNNFRFDSTLGPSGGYIFNFKTKGLASGSYLLEFTVSGDTNGVYAVPFAVK